MEKLPGEGEVKIIRKVRVRCACGYCGEPAFYKNTYLNDGERGARRNPASSACGKDDITWCSDYDDFLCPDCHQRNEADNVPAGYGWCSTFQADRFPQMFLHWQETDITEETDTIVCLAETVAARALQRRGDETDSLRKKEVG